MSLYIEDRAEAFLKWFFPLLIAVSVIFLISDCSRPRYGKSVRGIVVEKYFSPASTSIGTGVSSTGSTAVVTTSKNEEYALIVTVGDKTFAAMVEPSLWAARNKGDGITVTPVFGRHTGWRYKTEVGP